MIKITNKQLTIFLASLGSERLFILGKLSAYEMDNMSRPVWTQIGRIVRLSNLVKNTNSEPFKQVALKHIAESCENEEVVERILNIDLDKLSM